MSEDNHLETITRLHARAFIQKLELDAYKAMAEDEYHETMEKLERMSPDARRVFESEDFVSEYYPYLKQVNDELVDTLRELTTLLEYVPVGERGQDC